MDAPKLEKNKKIEEGDYSFIAKITVVSLGILTIIAAFIIFTIYLPEMSVIFKMLFSFLSGLAVVSIVGIGIGIGAAIIFTVKEKKKEE